MKSVIFYLSQKKAPNTQKIRAGKGRHLHIRVEMAHGMDCERALNRARPREGEVVLNTVDLDEMGVLVL